MHLIVGLGNPGRTFHETRHNIGFRVLDRLAATLKLTWRTEDSRAIAVARIDDLALAKPQQFMNRSGASVARLAKRLRLPPTNIWLVSDDIDLPFGQFRLRLKGSAGGHHGLESIFEHLHTTNLPRLRFGVGPAVKHANFDGATFVLHRFSSQERRALPGLVDHAVAALQLARERDFEAAMNVWNRKGATRRRF